MFNHIVVNVLHIIQIVGRLIGEGDAKLYGLAFFCIPHILVRAEKRAELIGECHADLLGKSHGVHIIIGVLQNSDAVGAVSTGQWECTVGVRQ